MQSALFRKPTQPVFRHMIQLKPSAESQERAHARAGSETYCGWGAQFLVHVQLVDECIHQDRKVHDNSKTVGHGAQLSVCVTHHRVSDWPLSGPRHVRMRAGDNSTGESWKQSEGVQVGFSVLVH